MPFMGHLGFDGYGDYGVFKGRITMQFRRWDRSSPHAPARRAVRRFRCIMRPVPLQDITRKAGYEPDDSGFGAVIDHVVDQSFAAIGLHRKYDADASTAMTLRMRARAGFSVTGPAADGGALGYPSSVAPQ